MRKALTTGKQQIPYTLFASEDYRVIIKEITHHLKAHEGIAIKDVDIADCCRISKSYLSKVFKGSANLSDDQLFRLQEALNLPDDQRLYLERSLASLRTGLEARKSQLRQLMRQQKSAWAKTEHHLQKQKALKQEDVHAYYLDPVNALVRTSLYIESYQTDIERLAVDLGLYPKRINSVLSKLESLNLIQILTDNSGKKRFRPVHIDLHLSADNSIYKAWRTMIKTMALARLNQQPESGDTPSENSYAVAGFVSGSKKLSEHLRQGYLRLLKEAKTFSEDDQDTDLFYLSLEVFPWMQTSEKP